MPKLTKNLLIRMITEEAKALELDLVDDSAQQLQQLQNISKFASAASAFYAAMDKFNKSLEELQLQGVKDSLTGGFDETMKSLHDMVKNPEKVPGLDAKQGDTAKPKLSQKVVLKPSKPAGKTF